MDDIYYWILSVWNTLTSRKGIIVSLGVVAAVVVTVTTVIAAPSDNNGRTTDEQQAVSDHDVFVSMEPPKATNTVFVSSGVLDPRETLSICGVDDPGILPTSPFFFLKEFGREFRYAFSFDDQNRADLKLRYANEDVLAMRQMLVDGEYLSAAQQCHSYQANFFAGLTWAVQLKKQGYDVDAYMTDLIVSHEGHRLVLAEALGVVDESWREAFIGAVTYTSAPLEQVIHWTMGESEAVAFQDKLANDFSSVDRDVWLQIDNRLGLDLEQAVALRDVMGDDSPVGTAPIISRVTPDSFDIEPGETVSIKCSASDLAGGELSYEWRAAEGVLGGNGEATIEWTAPEELGLYTVTVVVTDEQGNSSQKSVNLRVGEPESEPEPVSDGPFSIEEVTAERATDIGRSNISPLAIGQDWRTAERSVYIHSPIRITCHVDGAAYGLTYDWRAEGGTIEGDGETVIWTAPGHASKAQVTVVVRNGAGTTETATLNFRISTCAPCFQW